MLCLTGALRGQMHCNLSAIIFYKIVILNLKNIYSQDISSVESIFFPLGNCCHSSLLMSYQREKEKLLEKKDCQSASFVQLIR